MHHHLLKKTLGELTSSLENIEKQLGKFQGAIEKKPNVISVSEKKRDNNSRRKRAEKVVKEWLASGESTGQLWTAGKGLGGKVRAAFPEVPIGSGRLTFIDFVNGSPELFALISQTANQDPQVVKKKIRDFLDNYPNFISICTDVILEYLDHHGGRRAEDVERSKESQLKSAEKKSNVISVSEKKRDNNSRRKRAEKVVKEWLASGESTGQLWTAGKGLGGKVSAAFPEVPIGSGRLMFIDFVNSSPELSALISQTANQDPKVVKKKIRDFLDNYPNFISICTDVILEYLDHHERGEQGS